MKLDQYSNPTNISPEPVSQVNSTSHLRKDSYPSISNFSKKLRKEYSQTHCTKPAFILIPKPGNDTTKEKKLYTNIPNEHTCKNPQQNMSKSNSKID